ncbi:hypothetical protein BDK51DRAFT_27531, partial [Blyttiomyces helicus]
MKERELRELAVKAEREERQAASKEERKHLHVLIAEQMLEYAFNANWAKLQALRQPTDQQPHQEAKHEANAAAFKKEIGKERDLREAYEKTVSARLSGPYHADYAKLREA